MLSKNPLKLLLLSTPVGPLGSGLGGGVELTLANIAHELISRGHQVEVVTPQGSIADFPLAQVFGELQPTAQTQQRTDPILMPGQSVLANMWEYARQVQDRFDLLINFAYDWLPFYLTPFFHRPIAHLVSMGSLSAAIDQAIEQVAVQFPGTIGVHSQAQAATFTFGDRCRCLKNGFNLSQYEYCEQPSQGLAWVGRIAPEKGLEDAVAATQLTGIPLTIWGVIQDATYWQQICDIYTDAPVKYAGFLPTDELQQSLRQCQALLVTPRWVEAFGNVVVEALACGVPVIAYRRGGPTEIVQSGETGWLVEPDSVAGLVSAIARLDQIDRQACRRWAETEYSMQAMGDRLEAWFMDMLQR